MSAKQTRAKRVLEVPELVEQKQISFIQFLVTDI
jgi:hypothetical protein